MYATAQNRDGADRGEGGRGRNGRNGRNGREQQADDNKGAGGERPFGQGAGWGETGREIFREWEGVGGEVKANKGIGNNDEV